MRVSRYLLALSAVVSLTVLATHAQSLVLDKDDGWTTTDRGVLPSTSALHIKANGGNLSIETGSGKRITYQVRVKNFRNSSALLAHPYHLKTHVSTNDVGLVATRNFAVSKTTPTLVVVYVPSQLQSLTLDVDGGEVQVGKLASAVVIHSAGGNITLGDIGSSARVETAGDGINIGTVRGDGWFYTAGGKISINLVKGNINAWTGAGTILVNTGERDALLQAGAGDIRITNCGGQLKVASGGGNLVMGDILGRADLSTNGGNIQLHSARGFVRAQTSGGNIDLSSVPAASVQTGGGSISATFVRSRQKTVEDSFLRTNAGDITVYLPPDLAVTVDASIDMANGHGITSEFPEIHVESADTLPRTMIAEGALNGGGPLLKLHVTTGNISIQKIPVLRAQLR